MTGVAWVQFVPINKCTLKVNPDEVVFRPIENSVNSDSTTDCCNIGNPIGVLYSTLPPMVVAVKGSLMLMDPPQPTSSLSAND